MRLWQCVQILGKFERTKPLQLAIYDGKIWWDRKPGLRYIWVRLHRVLYPIAAAPSLSTNLGNRSEEYFIHTPSISRTTQTDFSTPSPLVQKKYLY